VAGLSGMDRSLTSVGTVLRLSPCVIFVHAIAVSLGVWTVLSLVSYGIFFRHSFGSVLRIDNLLGS